MSADKLNQIVNSLAKKVEDNEKLATPILAAKVAKFLASYPHDQTLGAMSRVLDRMAENQKIFIRRADLKALYSKLYSSNTKFGELFQDELGVAPSEPSVKLYDRDNGADVSPYQVADTVLANALNSVFDHTLPLKMYSQPLADKALKSVALTLDTWNLNPSSLTVDDGSDKFLVIKADYETPKGTTSLYIPVEIHNGKVVEAEVFMGNAGPQELNNANLKSYVTRFAGSRLKVTAGSILNVLTKGVTPVSEISEAEMALTRLNAKKEGSTEFAQNQIVGQKVAEASVKDVELPQSKEFASFEDQFTSPLGVAAFKFTKASVDAGRNAVVRELVGFGHKNPQVALGGSNENTLFYGVSLDGGKVAFTVPVKIEGGKLAHPSVMLCNGSISELSPESISDLYVNNVTDSRAQASSSPLFDVKPSELINHIRSALAEGNHSKAEDALNVLANSGDDKAYATGFNMFLNGLSDKKVEAAPTANCSRIVKNSTSQHAICGHTGLPLHKVYQDKHGNCLPLYRKGMDETYEGATFMNSKIFG